MDFLSGFLTRRYHSEVPCALLQGATVLFVPGLSAIVGRDRSLLIHSPVSGTVREFPIWGSATKSFCEDMHFLFSWVERTV